MARSTFALLVLPLLFTLAHAGRFSSIPGSIDIGAGLAPIYARELEAAIRADVIGKLDGTNAQFSLVLAQIDPPALIYSMLNL